MNRSVFRFCLYSLLGLCAVVSLRAGNWPQWRGPEGSGISNEKELPTEWSETKNIRWKTAIPGRGHSSPVVWGDRIFLTTAVEGPLLEEGPQAITHMLGDKEFKHPDWVGSDHTWSFQVICLERKTGKVLWQKTAYDGKVYDHKHRMNTYASSTPFTDGRFLFVHFGSEGTYCYDLDGNLLWSKSLGGIGTMGMGTGTSPLVYRENLILVADQEFDGADSYMVALDKKDGHEVWRVKRSARATWATPLLVERQGHATELVVSGAEEVISYDPLTGRELWKTKGVESHAIPSPVTDDENLYLAAGSQAKRAMAIRLNGSDPGSSSREIVWEYDKGTAYVTSPILYQGYLYLISDKGIITCLNAKTGKVEYEGGRMPTATTVKSSPVAFEGKILLPTEDGETFVIKAGPEFEIIGSNPIGEPIWSSIAISDGMLFLRGQEHLYAIGNPESATR